VAQVPFTQVPSGPQAPQSVVPPQPSEMSPHAFASQVRGSQVTHEDESASQTSGDAQVPQSSVAPHPSVTVPHATPAAVQLRTGHSVHS
jgi:hypothetical protein